MGLSKIFKSWYFWLVVSLLFIRSIIGEVGNGLLFAEILGFFFGSVITVTIIFLIGYFLLTIYRKVFKKK